MSLRTVDSLAIEKQPNCFSQFSSNVISNSSRLMKLDNLNSPKFSWDLKIEWRLSGHFPCKCMVILTDFPYTSALFGLVPSRERIHIPPKWHFESMIFLFPRWDMLIPWRVIQSIMAPVKVHTSGFANSLSVTSVGRVFQLTWPYGHQQRGWVDMSYSQ